MICDICKKEITEEQTRAYGPENKVSHARCAKVAKAHGRIVEMEQCSNCGDRKEKGETCFQCGVGPKIG